MSIENAIAAANAGLLVENISQFSCENEIPEDEIEEMSKNIINHNGGTYCYHTFVFPGGELRASYLVISSIFSLAARG